MRRRILFLLALIVGAIALFALGLGAAALLGMVPRSTFVGRPVATISLDLADQVVRLQQERARLDIALVAGRQRIVALERELAERRRSAPSANAESGTAVAALEAELQQAIQRNTALAARIEQLERERDRAGEALAAGTRTVATLEGEHGKAVRALTASRAAIETLRDERDAARKAAAENSATAESLQRDLAGVIAERDARQQALNTENARLREAGDRKDATIAALRQTIEALDSRASKAVGPPPVQNAPPPSPAPPELHTSRTPAGTVADGVAAYNAGNFAAAYRIWRPLAENGDARAQFHLGALYYEGRGVIRDLDEARTWLGRAAANGSGPARSLLAQLDSEPR